MRHPPSLSHDPPPYPSLRVTAWFSGSDYLFHVLTYWRQTIIHLYCLESVKWLHHRFSVHRSGRDLLLPCFKMIAPQILCSPVGISYSPASKWLHHRFPVHWSGRDLLLPCFKMIAPQILCSPVGKGSLTPLFQNDCTTDSLFTDREWIFLIPLLVESIKLLHYRFSVHGVEVDCFTIHRFFHGVEAEHLTSFLKWWGICEMTVTKMFSSWDGMGWDVLLTRIYCMTFYCLMCISWTDLFLVWHFNYSRREVRSSESTCDRMAVTYSGSTL